jgi:hypothetical protein
MMLMMMKDVSFDSGGGMRDADNDGEAKNLVMWIVPIQAMLALTR